MVKLQQFMNCIQTDIEAVKHTLAYSQSNSIAKLKLNDTKVIKCKMDGWVALEALSKNILHEF